MKNLQQVLRDKEKQLLELQQEIEILRNAGQILRARREPPANFGLGGSGPRAVVRWLQFKKIGVGFGKSWDEDK